MTTRASTLRSPTSAPVSPRFRGDVEGLRALAVGAVVVAHADQRLAPGGYVGVDVFFVISGFLITLLLLREHAETGRISLTRFWARRVRRLLPMSALTLLTSLIVAWLLFPPVDVPDVASSVRAASLLQENWHLIAGATDYFSRDLTHDPLLHFWSLSVEEQFYALWPVLLVLSLLVARRCTPRRASSTVVAAVLASVLAVSFVASATLTASVPVAAYYSLRTRAWELAVGAIVAAWAGRLAARLTSRGRSVLALGGLGAIISAIGLFDPQTPFPGVAAALPVLGAAAVIAAGHGASPTLVARLLSSATPRFVGRVSYSWYLWHWPALVTCQVVFLARAEANHPSEVRRSVVAAAAVAGSFLLAVVSQRLVEVPIRRSSWLRASRLATFALGGLLVGGVVAASAWLDRRPTGLTPVAPAARFAIASPARGARLVADLSVARADWLGPLKGCVNRAQSDARAACVLGDRAAGPRVVIVGDSHAAALVPALDALARVRHWRLEVATHNGCPFVDGRVAATTGAESEYCERWHAKVVRRLLAGGPIAVLIVANAAGEAPRLLGDDGRGLNAAEVPTVWGRALARTVALFRGVAGRVIVVQEPALPKSDPIECLTLNAEDVSLCSFDRRTLAHPDRDLLAGAAAALRGAGVRYADLTPLLCPHPRCPVVTAGGIVMFKDTGHLARAFSASIGALVGLALDNATPLPSVRS